MHHICGSLPLPVLYDTVCFGIFRPVAHGGLVALLSLKPVAHGGLVSHLNI